VSLEKFVRDLNIVNPEEIRISLNQDNTILNINYKNKIYTDIVPERPFPISNPNFVIIKSSNGSDLCTIKNIKNLEPISRGNLEKYLNILYFIPEITNILRLSTSGDKFEWEVETERGERKFTTSGRNSIVDIGERIVIMDTDDNLYQITCIDDLDEKSKKIIKSTF
jgi:hypothetical protein